MNPTIKTPVLVLIAAVVLFAVWYKFLRGVKAPAAGPGMVTVPGPAAQAMPALQATSPVGVTVSKVPLSSVMNQ